MLPYNGDFVSNVVSAMVSDFDTPLICSLNNVRVMRDKKLGDHAKVNISINNVSKKFHTRKEDVGFTFVLMCEGETTRAMIERVQGSMTNGSGVTYL